MANDRPEYPFRFASRYKHITDNLMPHNRAVAKVVLWIVDCTGILLSRKMFVRVSEEKLRKRRVF